jgi:hypothetical protein
MATTQVQVVQQPIYYVDINSPSPASPYINWATAAHTIQQAIAADTTPGRLVLVTNGVYRIPGIIYGNGALYNNVALTNAVVVQSANGPDVTTIWPSFLGRCAYVGSNAILSGFTLTGGSTSPRGDGGGAWCEPGAMLSNCVISGNSAHDNGGGAYQGTFCNCVFTNNHFGTAGSSQGGGVFGGTLYNCTLISNSAANANDAGSGASQSTLYNCTLTGNQGALSGDFGSGANASTLYNCTVTSNYAAFGGGACSNTMYNCILTGNLAYQGGGSFGGTLYNCVLSGNLANNFGGGAYSSTLYNCTVAGNSAVTGGGGVYSCTLSNSIVYFNTVNNGSSTSNWLGGTLRWCCTAPLPGGPGNITGDPLFMNLAAGDLRLHFGSPCIDTGTNLSAFITNDIAGNPRPLDGDGDGVAKFDMGAYEFDLLSTVGINWLISHGLNPNDPFVFTHDPDGDGFTTLQEWVADTDPTNANSFFEITAISNLPPVTVYFQSSSNRIYTLQSSTNLLTGWTPVPGQASMPGNGGLMGLTDINSASQQFYRVSVEIP